MQAVLRQPGNARSVSGVVLQGHAVLSRPSADTALVEGQMLGDLGEGEPTDVP
jgi:hypothetical protein